jgi:predicted dehydrogenase
VQTVGLGPHRENRHTRAAWFYDKRRYGGILADIASHQIDQFLMFTGASDARITLARAGNVAHPDDPLFEDFGEVALAAGKASGYIRVDWFTADGLPTWGDGRLFIVGTRGTIELRKYVDIAGRPGKDHLFLVDGQGTRHLDCSDAPLPYYRNLHHDIVHRTETAMTHAHCYKVCELALTAQARAERVGA